MTWAQDSRQQVHPMPRHKLQSQQATTAFAAIAAQTSSISAKNGKNTRILAVLAKQSTQPLWRKGRANCLQHQKQRISIMGCFCPAANPQPSCWQGFHAVPATLLGTPSRHSAQLPAHMTASPTIHNSNSHTSCSQQPGPNCNDPACGRRWVQSPAKARQPPTMNEQSTSAKQGAVSTTRFTHQSDKPYGTTSRYTGRQGCTTQARMP